MKTNKVSFWVTLALAIVSLVAGIIIMILPSNCPVTVEGDVTATYTTGKINLHGKITTTSDDDIYISKLVIVIKTSGDTIEATKSSLVVSQDEPIDLGDYYVDSYDRPTGVSRVTVTIDGKSYDIYGNTVPVWAVACFILAAVFVLVAISVFATNRKKMKALAAAEQTMPELGENAVKFDGYFSKKGEKGKAAAKSAVSALGGAASALVLGFGSFRVYGSGTVVELIVSDNGLCIVDTVNGNGATFIEKGKFPPSEITVKKTDVTLTNTMTTEYFVFKTKKAAMTAEQLVRKLTELTTAQPAPAETATTDAVADANTEVPEEK